MQKWEYTWFVTEGRLVQELNNMGSEGWELLGEPQQIASDFDKMTWRAFFKRPLSE